MGLGLYAWFNPEDAERYRSHLLNRGAVDLVVVVYEIPADDLHRLKQLDLTQLSDEEITLWLEKFSENGNGEPHGHEYLVRNTGMGIEYYFASSVFNLLKEVP